MLNLVPNFTKLLISSIMQQESQSFFSDDWKGWEIWDLIVAKVVAPNLTIIYF